MATRTFAGPGADNWVAATPVATDTALFSTNSGSMTEDFAAIEAVELAAVIFDTTYTGRVGDENNGWGLECSGEVTNKSQSPFIHLTGGDIENVERVVHAPTTPQATMLLSNGAFAEVVAASNGLLVIRGDATIASNVQATQTAFVRIFAGAGSYAGVTASGRSQVDVHENPATNGLDVMDQAIVRVLHNTASVSANLYGGTLDFRGGEIAGLYGLAGHLDCSRATANVVLSGSGIQVGPGLRVTPPPPPYIINVTGTVTFQGGVPSGWPGNYS